ncbi:MAG: response regulator, partial [Chlorobiaceae bacterium]|nr:response regulator [Chlorobiaceae bacterium]
SWCSIPLILLTAKDTGEDREKGLKLGAVDYITKPFNLEELGEKIEKIIAGS